MKPKAHPYTRLDKACGSSLQLMLQWMSVLSFLIVLIPTQVQAQGITPANDGTGTVIRRNGNRVDIQGGSQSRDNANLFQSFEEFGLTQGEIANFIANPQTRNILGRVVGGNSSRIDGLIRVTGGNPNLFLMNPAGIIFGANARLNVPASFTATTANGIFFDSGWFNAIDFNDYANLVGSPSGFAFTMGQPGTIINAGDLTVPTGQSLTLLGGTVINTGGLAAPQGQITIAAVPGKSLVRLSLSEGLLNLVVQPITPDSSHPNDWILPIDSLPSLLSNLPRDDNLGIVINPDGTAQLAASGVRVPTAAGTAIASGRLDVSGLLAGTIGVLGDRVGVVEAEINASGVNGGGRVLLGGNYQGQGPIPRSDRMFVNGGSQINADALQSGNGGQIIVWSDEATSFEGNATAKGGALLGNGGLIEISGAENLAFQGTANVEAAVGVAGTVLFDPQDINIVPTNDSENNNGELSDGQILFADGGNTSIFEISADRLEEIDGNVTLQATGNINLNTSLNFNRPSVPNTSVNFVANGSFNGSGQLITAIGRNVTIAGATGVTVGGIDTGISGNNSSTSNGGNIILTSNNGDIEIITGSLNSSSLGGSGGIIQLSALGKISTNTIDSRSLANSSTSSGAGGAVTITTGSSEVNGGDITTGTIFSSSYVFAGNGNSGNGGEISLNANGGSIRTFDLWSQSESLSNDNKDGGISASGGNIILQTRGSGIISAGNVEAYSLGRTGGGSSGEVAFTSGGNLTINGFVNTYSAAIVNNALTGGSIRLVSGGDVITKVLNTATDSRVGVSGGGGEIFIEANGTVSANSIGLGSRGAGSGESSGSLTILTPGIVDFSNTVLESNGADINLGSLDSSTQYRLPPVLNTAGGSFTILRNGDLDFTTEINTTGVTRNGNVIINGTGVLTASSPITTNGGNVELRGSTINTAPTSVINTGTGNLTLGSSGAITVSGDVITNGGNVSIGEAQTGAIAISSSITTNGGNITLRGSTIDTTNSFLRSLSTTGNGGDITLEADGNITAGDLSATGTTSGGGISFISDRGDISLGNVTLGSETSRIGAPLRINTPGIVSFQGSLNSNGSNIRLGSQTPLRNVFLPTAINTNGGNFSLNTSRRVALSSNILTGGGNFGLTSPGLLQISGAVQTDGGDIFLQGSTIDSTATVLNSSSNTRRGGGRITLNASNEIRTADLNAAANNGTGGDIALRTTGDIVTRDLTSNATGTRGAGGNVTVDNRAGGAIRTGNVNTGARFGNGGVIRLLAQDSIQSGRITSRSQNANGGSVTLDPSGDIQVASINTRGQNQGGSVNVTTDRYFRVTDTIPGTNTSISTAGGQSGGDIAIRHGGDGLIPFTVGDSALNGTAGGVTSRFAALASIPYLFTTAVEPNVSLVSVESPSQDRVDPKVEIPPTLTPNIVQIPSPSIEVFNIPRRIEDKFKRDFDDYWKTGVGDRVRTLSLAEISQALKQIESDTGVKPAVIYANFIAPELASPELPAEIIQSNLLNQSEDDLLELVVVTSGGVPYRKVMAVTRQQVTKVAEALSTEINNENRKKGNPKGYLDDAKQLYRWLVAPIESEMQTRGIDNLVFIVDEGLRAAPLAALYDEINSKYLVQKYSVGLAPSFSLIDYHYRSIGRANVLAMGASRFGNTASQSELVSIPIQVNSIFQEGWAGSCFLDESFTFSNLVRARQPNFLTQQDERCQPNPVEAKAQQSPFEIIHLATHADFQSGKPENSYIQLYDSRLAFKLEELQQLGWNSPTVKLLFLNACRTAIGDRDSELGFAGIAYRTGVTSAVASLWYVKEGASLALVPEFYRQLKQTRIKAEALRRAQVAMIEKTTVYRNGFLSFPDGSKIPLSSDMQNELEGIPALDDPYYWAAFTMVGSPW
jgi:filamentous hemagglutinin family protein